MEGGNDDDDEDASTSNMDRRGRPGKLNKTMKRWLTDLDPSFDCKVSPFNGGDEDDEDLKTWVHDKWRLFAIFFANDIENSEHTLGAWEKVCISQASYYIVPSQLTNIGRRSRTDTKTGRTII